MTERRLAEHVPCDWCSYPHGHTGHTEPECDQCDENYAGISQITLEDHGTGEVSIHYLDREGRPCAVMVCGPNGMPEALAFQKRYGP